VGSVCGFMPRPTSTSSGPRRQGIDFTTLWITAVASAAAAYTCSKLWAPGTLPSAAATPVLVALIREGLQRPAEAVTRVVPVRGVVRSAGSPDANEPEPEPEREPPNRLRRHWRVAVVTGLLGFLVAAVVLTVPELVAGGSAGGGGRGTTLFGGDKDSTKQEPQQDPDPSGTAPKRTVTTPGRTVTVAPPTKTTPTTPTTPAPSTTTAPAPPPAPAQP
jgi:hypothetical protein